MTGDAQQEPLSPSEERVAEFAQRDPLRFATITAAEIAAQTMTSDATVARTARKLGYAGIREWKRLCAENVDRAIGLDSNLRSQLSRLPERDEEGGQAIAIKRILSTSARSLVELGDQLDTETFAEAVRAISEAGRATTFGLGTGFHAAEYLSLSLERVGIRSQATTGSGHMLADVFPRLQHDDVSVVVAPRLLTADVLWHIEESLKRCHITVLISSAAPPRNLAKGLLHLSLPSGEDASVNRMVCTFALIDVLAYELARLAPSRAVERSAEVQKIRDRLNRSRRK
ncbi:MurR/RpiR family transcriptional regulator [Brevibacterium sp. FAM 25378]|uniref:MurR/RpiR family transcriptional regulator n=1 Tax=unclassified Brevibacterium TaxID=2614124 RepID=UPI001092CD30|nr:SIS domain-containing protein [Brevibacterium sp. S22]TGD31415.1 MurR/RpiR family transcriptional regulator [Brevibacterium sp. S22]